MLVVSRTRRLGRARYLLLCLLLGVALLAPTSPVAHAAVPPVSPRTASVVTADPLPTAQINGVVWAQAIAGNQWFAGGEFSSARPAGSAPGANEQPRWNLVSVNLATGALNSFAPQLNGPVKALAISTDGTLLFVAGSFTRVGDQVRNRFAVFRVADGTLHPRNPSFNGTVNALAVTPSATYAGGSFSTVNGVARSRLAAVRGYVGELTGWAPVADATVNALTATGDHTKIIAGGSFNQVNGVAGRGLVALDAATGAHKTWKVNGVVMNYGPNAAILNLAADRDTVYGTGYAYGGGNFEGVFAADDTQGDVRWLQDCHGDSYAAAPVGDTVYSVGHAHFCSNIGGFPDPQPRREYRALAVTKAALGTVAPNSQPGRSYGDFGGQPAPSLVNWFPDVSPGTFTGLNQGAWSVAGNADYLVLGGEFTKVGGIAQQGLVRFTLPGRSPVMRGAEDRSAGIAPTVYPGTTAGTAVVRWPANWDRDEMTLGYDVLRDGAVVGSTTARSTFWNRPVLQLTDRGLRAGTSYRYEIRVRHRVDPVTSPATTFSYPAAAAYATRINAADPIHQWRLGSPPGTTSDPDQAGSAPLQLNPETGLGASGALRGSTDKAIVANPGATADASTAATEPATASLSLELWVKAWVPAGSLLAFGSTPGTTATVRSRELYLNSSGQLTYAVRREGQGPLVVQTGRSLADDQWHHVVVTQTSGSTALFVDGLQVSSSTTSPGVTEPGRWWVGGRTPSGLPSATARGLGAKVDEVTVFDRALSPTEVHQHFGWGWQ